MRLNEKTAVATAGVLLVPYCKHHVLQYHGWMQDPAIQAATASEPLSLSEEFENQASWRAAPDKLTFIVCDPLDPPSAACVRAGDADAAHRTRGDVNLFLHVADDDDDDDEDDTSSDVGTPAAEAPAPWLVGEVDVMVAAGEHRGRGLGGEAVRALLAYLCRHRDAVLAEYGRRGPRHRGVRLKGVVAKIQRDNAASTALFTRLGFRQQGGVNYFGEVTMAMAWADVEARVGEGEGWVQRYREAAYE